ncbi:biotin transporter BioY [Xanthobacter sp. V4C-4]|uniref:biotin transporter BioY n=1 Tax=Xanthobacter cornucopiae TaxID=3119924 RepID=UPI0037261B34
MPVPPFRPAFQRLAEASPPWAVALVVISVALLAWSAQISLPVQPVPVTLQSYVLLTLAALLGWRLGALVITAYIALGLAGLPVFANGARGFSVLTGASAGFLAGFVVVALGVGGLQQYWARLRPLPLFGVLALGHLVLMVMGAGWIATRSGYVVAFEKAFLPFVPGAVVKSIAALATVVLVERFAGTPRR